MQQTSSSKATAKQRPIQRQTRSDENQGSLASVGETTARQPLACAGRRLRNTKRHHTIELVRGFLGSVGSLYLERRPFG